MKPSRLFAAMAVAALLVGRLPAAETPTNTVIKVAITNLLSDMKHYYLMRVEVTGYYRSSFELSALYQSHEDAKALRDERALYIKPFVKPGFEGKVRFIKEGHVRVVGVFHYNLEDPKLGVGHLNGWPAEILALEAFEQIK
jgi:hypothetical protein